MSKIPNDVQKAFNDMLNNFDGLDVKYTDEDSTNHELYANITNADSYSDFKNKIESEFEKVNYSDMYDAVEYTKQTDFGQIIVEFLDDNRFGITVDWSYLADQMKDNSSEEVSECADLFESEASDDTEIAEVMANLFADDKADIRTKIVGDDLDYDVTYAGETVHVAFDDVEGKFKYYINGFGPYESTEAKDIENTIVNFIVTRGQNNKIEESISSVTRKHGLLKSEAADMYRAGYALCLSEDCKSIFSKAADYAQFCEGKDVNGNDIKRDFKTRDIFKVRHITEGTMYKRISNYDEFDNGNVIHSDWSKLSAEAAEDLAKQKSIEHPDQIFYVQYDDVMEPCSDLRWVNGKSYNWSDIKFIEGKPVIISVNEAISSVEPISPFKRGVRTTSCLTKDRKWDVAVDEAGNILARSRHGKPQYFKGTIDDKVNDFPCTDEDNIILAAREQFKLNFNITADNVPDNYKTNDLKEAVSKIKITNVSSKDPIYDTAQTGISIFATVNGKKFEFMFYGNHGKEIVDGVDCDEVKFNNRHHERLFVTGGTARSYPLEIPEKIMKADPKPNQKDFSFTGTQYKNKSILTYFKTKLTDLLTNHTEFFAPWFLREIGLNEAAEESLQEAFEKAGGPFWYFTKHGVQPGSVPKDIQILDIIDCANGSGTYFKSNKVLTAKELNDFEIVEKKPQGLKEASYGGAYDIADDQYFTKEELVEFGEDVVDNLNSLAYSRAKLESIFIDNNVIKITISWDGNEITVEQPIDMRRIRTPKDLEKYRIPVISKMKPELNKLGFDFGPHPLQDESLNESSDYELARPNSVKLMSYINRGSINPEDALSSLIDYLSDGEVGEFLDYIVGEYDLDESLNDSFREEVEPGKYVIRSFAKAANPYVAEYSRKTGKHIGYLGDGGRSWVPADSKSIMTFDTYDEAAAYAEDKVKDFYNAEVFKVERPLELEENCSDGDFKNQLIDDLTKQFFSREEAVKLVDKDINWAENLAYGNATPEDFIEAEEWLANN